MPKLKTNSCAKKRFKITAKGKIKFKHAGLRHLLSHESSNVKRPKRKPGYVDSTQVKDILKLLPYR